MINCNNSQNQAVANNSNLSFKIDPQLLSSKPLKDDDGFSIFIPKGWSALDSTNLLQLRNALESDENSIHLKLLGAFQSKNIATAIISKVNYHSNDFGFLPINFLELLKGQFATNNINVTDIIINDLDVKQFIITNNTHIVFKLFIGGNKNYQVDYIIPREIYESELGKVESSIGTITDKGDKQ